MTIHGSRTFRNVRGSSWNPKSLVSPCLKPERNLTMRPRRNAKRLNDRYLQTVRLPATGRLEILDTEAPGLVLRVNPAGLKSWTIRYRPKGEPQRRASFGSYPVISLAEARQRAREIAAAAGRGVDLPAQAARAVENQRQAGRPSTVSGVLDRYIAEYCEPNQRRWQLTKRMFDNHVKPAIGDWRLGDLRRADLVEMLDDLQNKKGFRAQVNRVRSQVVAALNWAIEREWIETNPAAAIRKRRIEAARERVLSHDELRAIWHAADRLSDPSRAFVKILILTGQRRDEIRCMLRSEINRQESIWILPKERNKGKRDHPLPLSQAVSDIIKDLPNLGHFVFTVSGERPYAGTKRLKEILDRESGVTGWVLHDIRRTVRSGLAELHVPEEIAERVLNHAKKGLAKVYDRHAYTEEMRIALEGWAEHVSFIVGDARDVANIIPFGDKQVMT
jgi:integrase